MAVLPAFNCGGLRVVLNSKGCENFIVLHSWEDLRSKVLVFPPLLVN